jgi:hypothetical protein
VLDLDGASGAECAGASRRLWRSGPHVENPPPAAIWDKRRVNQSIGYISLVVRDYDAAIDFYVHKLDFTLLLQLSSEGC